MGKLDSLLQGIAEDITNEGLNYTGAEFEHIETGELFSITVAKESAERKLTERIKELETHLSRMTNFYGIELREHGIDATTDRCYMDTMRVLEKGK